MTLISLTFLLILTVVFPAFSETTNQDSLTILITGSYRGRINGCHCPSSSKGGLAERKTLLDKQFSGKNLLMLDCGGFLDLDPDAGRRASICTLKGLKKLGLSIAGVSMRDLFYGLEFVKQAADSASIELICANLLNGSTGKQIFSSWSVHDITGMTVAVTCVLEHLSGFRVPGAGDCRTIPSDSVISDLRKSIPEGADFIILLTDIRESGLRELIPTFPELDLIFTSSRRIVSPSPIYIESVIVIRPMPDGGAIDGITIPRDWSKGKAFSYFSLPIDNKVTAEGSTEKWIKDCLGWSEK